MEDDQGLTVLNALRDLGRLWGLKRDLRYSELGRALRLGPGDPGASVANWATNAFKIPGPASCAIEMMLLGSLPPDGLDAVIITAKRRSRPERKGLKVGESPRD